MFAFKFVSSCVRSNTLSDSNTTYSGGNQTNDNIVRTYVYVDRDDRNWKNWTLFYNSCRCLNWCYVLLLNIFDFHPPTNLLIFRSGCYVIIIVHVRLTFRRIRSIKFLFERNRHLNVNYQTNVSRKPFGDTTIFITI